MEDTTQKKCKVCGFIKKITSFSFTGPGQKYRRNECHTCYGRKRKENSARRRSYLKKYRKENSEYFNEKYKEWVLNNRDQYKANQKLNYFVRTRNPEKPPCFICDNPNVEAHHVDYNKPLLVCWLCRNCHRRADTGEIRMSEYISGLIQYSLTNLETKKQRS